MEFKGLSSEKARAKDSKKAIYTLGLLGLIMTWAIWSKQGDEKQLTQYQKETIGRITNAIAGKTNLIEFNYYINGKEYEGSDRYSLDYPQRVRLSRPKKGTYHIVEYDSTDHTNHRIVIGKQPIDPRKEIQISMTVEGCVTRQLAIDDYRDLYIDYKVKNIPYSFRTRLHKDSISLYDSQKCLGQKAIAIEVSKRYPMFNQLYYKSQDRQYKGAYSTEGKWNE